MIDYVFERFFVLPHFAKIHFLICNPKFPKSQIS